MSGADGGPLAQHFYFYFFNLVFELKGHCLTLEKRNICLPEILTDHRKVLELSLRTITELKSCRNGPKTQIEIWTNQNKWHLQEKIALFSC